ncbi:MAG: hypothetical protein MUF64_27375 [Polyangiaceae bacterium]|nr:hypothetical protein [Polyangiaceae bacterium]
MTLLNFHRVMGISMETTCRIILDANIIRGTISGNAAIGLDLAVLEALRGRAPVSLSQTAYLELTNQLRNQRFTFDEWQAIAPVLDKLIDPIIPIVPIGIALRVMLGVATAHELELKNGFSGLRAMWHVLKTATSSSDVTEGQRIMFEGELREFRPSGIKAEFDKTEKRWGRAFEGLVKALGRPVRPDDRSWLADAIRRHFGNEDVRQIPELETAVQLAVEFLVLHGLGYKKGKGYRPKLNDAMDFDQLYALGLPAIICTSDGKFLNRVRSLKTPGSERVLYPNELISHLRSVAA